MSLAVTSVVGTRRDESLISMTINHPNLGSGFLHANLENIQTEYFTDPVTVSEPGKGGGVVISIKAGTARKIMVEVKSGTSEDKFLRDCQKFLTVPFVLNWEDARNPLSIQGGVGSDCVIMPTTNDTGAETRTYEIACTIYNGD